MYYSLTVISFVVLNKNDVSCSGEAHIADHLASILVLAFPTGKMMWVPTSTLPAACVLDMTYWPHDKHKCTVKFGSWVHSGNDIDLNPKDDVTEVEVISVWGW